MLKIQGHVRAKVWAREVSRWNVRALHDENSNPMPDWVASAGEAAWSSALRFFAVAIVAVTLLSPWATAETTEGPTMDVKLPRNVGSWVLSDGGKKIEPSAIFDYMDGAGELYLGYRFRFLEVHEFKSPGQSDILVELYWMESSDDAYGLLSGDWGGEPVPLSADGKSEGAGSVRALYGAGLLRIWTGALYARVMAYEETGASRQAVLSLGRAIVAGRPESDLPRLVQLLPLVAGGNLHIRPDRTVFLRSHLVLNSVYYLSSENLLDLGLEGEAVASVYGGEPGTNVTKPVRVLLLRYRDDETARKALEHFQRVYLAGLSFDPRERGTTRLEDGWMGFVLSGRGLGIVFESPDEATTRLFLENSKQALDKLETIP